MRPRVGSNLVTFIDHAPEQVRPRGRGVDLPFTQVVPRDKERRREAVPLEEIQQPAGVNKWPIIVRQSHHVCLGTAKDIAIIRYVP